MAVRTELEGVIDYDASFDPRRATQAPQDAAIRDND